MRRLFFILLTLVLWTAGALPGAATETTAARYHEDFTSRLFCDLPATTADWDTVAGALHLPVFEFTVVGSWDSPGAAFGVAVDGDYAYLADGASGLKVIDVSDPENPAPLGSYASGSTCYAVDSEGDVVYLADGFAGLRAIDVSDPSSPSSLGVFNTPGCVYAVEVQGDLAYVADGTGGLRVIYVHDPAAMFQIGSLGITGGVYGLDIEGDVAYLAAYDHGLVAVDVSTPTAPVVLGGYDTAGYANGVVVDGDYAFVADGPNGLVVIDVVDPQWPEIVTTLDTPDRANAVAIDGDWVYVADVLGGLHAVSVADPVHPVLAQTCNPPASARAVALDGRHAFVADYSNGLQVVSIKELDIAPAPLGALDTSQAYGLTVEGNRVFVCDQAAGLRIVDVSDPMSPVLVSTVSTPDWAWKVKIAGDVAYLADYGAGLVVIDVQDHGAAAIIGQLGGLGNTTGLDIAGDYAYLAAGSTLRVIDITDPTAPTLAGTLTPTGWTVRDVFVAGNLAFLAVTQSGMCIVDITDPTSPVLLSTFPGTNSVYDVIAAGNVAYLAEFDRIRIVDISNPAAPTLISSLLTGYASDLDLAGDELFVVAAYSGIKVVDVSDSADPTLVVTMDTEYASASDVAGDVVYASDHEDGIKLFRLFTRGMIRIAEARSLAVNSLDEDLRQLRVEAATSGDMAFEFSADGGATWISDPGDGSWFFPLASGTDLVWHANLVSPDGIADALCTDLGIDWRYTFPVITSVRDVPADQGGKVRVAFARSVNDFPNPPDDPVTGYNVWRRVDDPAVLAAAAEAPAAATDPALTGDIPLRDLDGRLLSAGDPSAKSSGLPPGTWEVLGSFWAAQLDDYSYPAATLADSAGTLPWSVYCVTAHTATPAVWFASPPDSGYSVDNIAPAVPADLHLAKDNNFLAWNSCPDADFQYFSVFGSATGELDGSETLIGHTTGVTLLVAGNLHPWFLVTATDCHGNRSEPGSLALMSGVPGAIPRTLALHPCVPNPFNPATVIRFDLPQAGPLRLEVFALDGRLVATLVDGQRSAGEHAEIWRGCDSRGNPVGSGVYFCRLTAGESRRTIKMVLVQ